MRRREPRSTIEEHRSTEEPDRCLALSRRRSTSVADGDAESPMPESPRGRGETASGDGRVERRLKSD
jgi:hypothetical protein